MIRRRTPRFLAAPVIALVMAACGGDALAPSALAPTDAPQLSSSAAPAILECPVDTTRSVTQTVGLLGGTVELDGHSVVIPASAVLLPTEFTLTVPASNYMEIRVTAAGEEHFEFLKPVSLTISYDRCTRSNIEKDDLQIFYIDDSDVILENMGGTDDKTARTVTTSSDHLSDYAIGAP